MSATFLSNVFFLIFPRSNVLKKFSSERLLHLWVTLCDPIWQVTFRSSVIGYHKELYLFYNDPM